MTSRRKRKKLNAPRAVEQRWDKNLDKRYKNDFFYEEGNSDWGAPVKYSRCRTCVGKPHHPPVFL